MNYNYLIALAKKAALLAGEEILKIYNTADFGVEAKADNSPLTLADQKAHLAIVAALEDSQLPVLSEEGRDIPFSERQNWTHFWMIDPLDGTKEFIKKNGQFTVNIALIENNLPVLGVVFAPVLNKLFFGGTAVDFSALQIGENEVILSKKPNRSLAEAKAVNPCRIVASLSHRNQETEDFIAECMQPEIIAMGSSLKFMVLAEQQADIYPRIAPTMEWDTAAADAVLRALNFAVVQVKNNEITEELVAYNKENLLNPYFVAY